jgi:transcriptional regulator with XRE-family HTH domain
MHKKRQKSNAILNRAEIARRLGVSRSYVSLLLCGKRTNSDRQEQIRRIVLSDTKGLFA